MIPTPKQKQLPQDIQKRAVAYARYSSASQRDVSIEQQLKDIRAFAQREGYIIVGEYADHAKSGYKNIEARHAFNAMMTAAASGTFGTVIAWKVDRFGRSREDSAIYKGRLRKHGVEVVYAMEPIPKGSAGVLMEGVLEATAEWYSRNLSELINRGLKDNAEKGLHNGTRMLGYLRTPDGRYGTDPFEAPVVREIYDLYAGGTSTMQIANILNQRGLTTCRGHAYSPTSIVRILRNERYTGVYIWKDTRIEDGMPVIIPRKLWEEVQQQLNTRQKRISKNNVDFLLTGKLFCGHCGGAMVGDSGTGKSGAVHYYYTCTNRKHGHTCNKKAVRKDLIEKSVIDFMLDTILKDSMIERLAQLVLDEQTKVEKSSVLTSMRAELAAIRKKIKNLNNAIADGIYSSSTLEMLKKLEAEEKEVAEAVATAEFTQAQVLDTQRIVYWMHRFVEGDREDAEFRIRLINTFLNAVYLYDSDDGGARMKVLINSAHDEAVVQHTELSGECLCSDNDTSSPLKKHPEESSSGCFFIYCFC